MINSNWFVWRGMFATSKFRVCRYVRINPYMRELQAYPLYFECEADARDEAIALNFRDAVEV